MAKITEGFAAIENPLRQATEIAKKNLKILLRNPTRVVQWYCNDGDREIHCFEEGAADRYIIGYNPDIFPIEDVVKFCADHGIYLDTKSVMKMKEEFNVKSTS